MYEMISYIKGHSNETGQLLEVKLLKIIYCAYIHSVESLAFSSAKIAVLWAKDV